MKKIELQPLKEWQEKEGNRVTGRIWIYVGGMHAGICTPKKNPTGDIPTYRFSAMQYGLLAELENDGYRTMDEIKVSVECALKEILTKFVKTYRTYSPVAKSTHLPKI